MPILTPGNVVFRQTWAPMDADAAAYITAVEQADGQALEETTKRAIDNFVLGCKSDGIWDAIKASCILAGARTLNGALVPLKGAAPTNFNFVSGDYNRKTGLVGDGATKYLDSNRNNNTSPQNNNHLSVYVVQPATFAYIGAGINQTGSTVLFNGFTRNNNTTSVVSNSGVGPTSNSFYGISRSNSADYLVRLNGRVFTAVRDSQTPFNGDLLVYARNTVASPSEFGNCRLAFYSIGEALDLARLDGRVTDLITAINAAF